jgi:hypothetical protein
MDAVSHKKVSCLEQIDVSRRLLHISFEPTATVQKSEIIKG